MRYIVMKTDDIRTNLATEQYLMNSGKLQPPFMLFYIEKPCIIVGRNQNTLEEINQKYCDEKGITITRRLSGGGAMYQDLGNLCFSFVVEADKQKFGDFKALVQPVVSALHAMGVTGAEVTGRNDIVIDGKKFSGNAMYSRNGKTFSHGTLMFDVNTDSVANALHVAKDKIESKGIKSVRSRVTNVKPYVDKQYQKMDTYQFRDELIKKIWHVADIKDAQQYAYELTKEDQLGIQAIEQRLYKNWDWVYGKSPEFTIKKRKHFAGGTIDARFLIEKGKIKDLKIYGDFFGPSDVAEVQTALIGIEYAPEQIVQALDKLDLSKYFVGISADDVKELLAYQH
ncbi:lipoate--protein ligase [Ligilactobacillus sp. WILCCON 0076]|uniref:lipoate--protein ligase n=1 Tax=Ligilactobacillus ubinensis TaxID=2876789 RepID=A0A9X2JM08_9LACO|nr:lipoate--protein ligase [Ligilactobacillus ubinensis]MCP0887190.1 lipoate--protein ligase [Ligilactobacillus ubinensis]